MNEANSFFAMLASGIAITAPIFFTIIAGALLRAFNILSPSVFDRLASAVYWFIMPATLFFGSLKLDFSSDIGSPYLLAGVVVTLLVISLSYGYGRWRGLPRAHIGIFVQGAYRSNLGLVGIALAVQAYGDAGLALATLPVAIWTLVYNVLAVFILNTTLSRQQSVSKSILNLLQNPLIWGIVLGALCARWGPTPSPLLLSGGGYLIQGSLFFALLSVGASFNIARLRANYAEALEASLWKLFITPLIAVGVAIAMGVEGLQLAVLFLLLAGPTATSSYLMVAAAGGNRELAADIVMLTSLFFPFSVTVGLFVLRALGMLP